MGHLKLHNFNLRVASVSAASRGAHGGCIRNPYDTAIMTAHTEGRITMNRATRRLMRSQQVKSRKHPSATTSFNYFRGTKETIPTTVCSCGNPKPSGVLCCDTCIDALEYYLYLRAMREGLDLEKFFENMWDDYGVGVAGKCSLCNGNYIFGGNNPQPVINDYNARCCERCNEEIVKPERIKNLYKIGRAY